jgi:hypothetical protein
MIFFFGKCLGFTVNCQANGIISAKINGSRLTYLYHINILLAIACGKNHKLLAKNYNLC